MSLYLLFISVAAAGIGGAAGFAWHHIHSRKQITASERRRDTLLTQAREEASKLRSDAQREVDEFRSRKNEEIIIQEEQIKRLEEKLHLKEEHAQRRLQSAQSKKQNVEKIEMEITRLREEMSAARSREIEKLSQICGVPVEHAVEIMLNQITEELEHDKLERLHRMNQFLEEEVEEKAKSIILSVIQRYALPASRESYSMYIDISNKKVRDKLLWNEEENLKKLQELTGIEYTIDQEGEVVLIHDYDLLKRTIAKQALDHALEQRGKVTPEELEKSVQLVRKRVHTDMDELGKKTLQELNIRDFDPRMVRLVGRLAYRTSFGQNILSHSTEVAFFSGLLAGEVGANVGICKRAGLMHDLGKGIDADVEGAHDVLSRDIGVKLGIDPIIIHAAYAHHEQVDFNTPEDILVQVADAISASRPGARQEATEQYIERIQALELLAGSFAGVSKAYAIQAGREIRVIVEPEEISDEEASRIAKEIAAKIEQDLTYPGEIMVHVIRETAVIDYAR